MPCSVASNVHDFEKATCFVGTGDPQDLVNQMIRRLEKKIADDTLRLLKDRFPSIYDQFTVLDLPDHRTKLNEYLKQLLVVGFNSGTYAINVIKSYFSHVICR